MLSAGCLPPDLSACRCHPYHGNDPTVIASISSNNSPAVPPKSGAFDYIALEGGIPGMSRFLRVFDRIRMSDGLNPLVPFTQIHFPTAK